MIALIVCILAIGLAIAAGLFLKPIILLGLTAAILIGWKVHAIKNRDRYLGSAGIGVGLICLLSLVCLFISWVIVAGIEHEKIFGWALYLKDFIIR